MEGSLYLAGLTSITDEQAESLSKVEVSLHLAGLTSITDEQAEILSKVAAWSFFKWLNFHH